MISLACTENGRGHEARLRPDSQRSYATEPVRSTRGDSENDCPKWSPHFEEVAAQEGTARKAAAKGRVPPTASRPGHRGPGQKPR